mmetsp:Transcript_42046/g.55415  ORF Transcript_42046/g.55415 Transcript_42046/m.55415 type:complete len:100 (+) Transcript_42046:664-963(+)
MAMSLVFFALMTRNLEIVRQNFRIMQASMASTGSNRKIPSLSHSQKSSFRVDVVGGGGVEGDMNSLGANETRHFASSFKEEHARPHLDGSADDDAIDID